MPTPFIGEVRIFAGNFAPQGWALCNGQLLSIIQNVQLWALLGTTYGGDGVTTFALPDLRGRVAIEPGQGPGLTNRALGESGGTETHALTAAEMPAHTHSMMISKSNGVADSPAGRVPARDPAATPQFTTTADTDLAAAAAGTTGGGQPHNNMQPYLTVTYIIALQGNYPAP